MSRSANSEKDAGAMGAKWDAALAIDRRTLLTVGGAVLVGAATGPLAAAASFSPARIRYVVTDNRIPQSMAFGDLLVRQGATRLEVTHGVTRMWQNVLRPHWRAGEGLTVGLTSVVLWQCLAEQARGERRRAQRIGRHRVEVMGDSASHVVLRPESAGALTRRLENGNDGWPAVAAQLVARCAVMPVASLHETICGSPRDLTGDHNMLTSWMIS